MEMTLEQQRALARAKARQRLAAQQQAEAPETAQPEAEAPSNLESFFRGAADMATFGFGDEIAAGTRTGFGLWGDYGSDVEATRGRIDAAREENPFAFGAGQVVGAVPSALVPGGAAVRGATMLGRVARGGLAGAAAGGLYGAGSAEEGERLQGAALGATVGGGLGMAIPGVGRVAGATVGRALRKPIAPTVDALKAHSQKLYAQAENMGMFVKPHAVDRLIARVNTEVRKAGGYHPKMLPNSATALEELGATQGSPASLARLDELRQFANTARSATNNAQERRIGSIIVNEIDDFLDRVSPFDVNLPKAQARQAVAVMKQARGLWRRQKKGRVIEDAIYNARQAASGFENGLRNEFRKLLKVKDGRNKYGWTKEERRLIERVVRGGGLVGGNLLKALGGFGFGDGRSTTSLFLGLTTGAGGGAVAGGLAGGGIGAAAVPLVASGARAASRAGTRAGAERAGALVRSGGRVRYGFNPRMARNADNAVTYGLSPLRQGLAVPLAVNNP